MPTLAGSWIWKQCVDRFKVEPHLSDVLRSKIGCLQFDCDVASESYVIEQQVDEERLAADLNWVLAPDESETSSECQEEAAHMLQKSIFHIALAGAFPQA